MLLLLLMAALSCRPPGKEAKGKNTPEVAAINVRAEHPQIRAMEEVIEVHGTLEAVAQVDVVTELSGTIVEVLAEAGDAVKQAQLLARIDDAEYKLNLRQAETAFTVARSDYLSTKALYDEGMKSKQELEKIKRAYEDARTNLELARLRLRNCEIRSPLSGVVVARKAELYHQAAVMEVLFTVADISAYVVRVTVTEAAVAKLRVGQPVRVRVDALASGPTDFPLSGRVKRIQPRVDPQTGTVEVEIAVEDPGPGARLGMFTRLKIVTAVHEQALVIPRRAAVGETGNFVWVADSGRARLVEIKTGLLDADGIEVLAGLSPEDLVIVEGQGALTEKSRIKIVNSSLSPPAASPPPSPLE